VRLVTQDPPRQHPHPVASVRLDQWLWAARLFRTRSLAKQAVEAGHVRYEGARAKVSRSVHPGAVLTVRQGQDETELVVRALSDTRAAAPLARLLYEETEPSRERRALAAARRKAAGATVSRQRPDKKQRRLIHRFKRGLDDG
jgi:ribosome-associated heat shock protein Hsp15